MWNCSQATQIRNLISLLTPSRMYRASVIPRAPEMVNPRHPTIPAPIQKPSFGASSGTTKLPHISGQFLEIFAGPTSLPKP